MIIGLSGYAGAGKDTAAAILVEAYGFRRVAFADLVKISAAAALDVPVESLERLKRHENAVVVVGVAVGGGQVVGQSQTLRSFLQRYGTEAHRDVFGVDFWVDLIYPDVHAHLAAGGAIVIPDVRFDNEAEAIRQLGGSVVEIVRPGLESDGHQSEEPPTPDYTILFDTVGTDIHNLIKRGAGV